MQLETTFSTVLPSIVAGYMATIAGMYKFTFHPRQKKLKEITEYQNPAIDLENVANKEGREVTFYRRGSQKLNKGTLFMPQGVEENNIEGVLIGLPGRARNRYFSPMLRELVNTALPQGYAVLLMDSPKGKSTLGLREKDDVLGAVDYLRKEEGLGVPIGVVAQSQGAHSALFAAAEAPNEIQAIWADSPHSNLNELFNEDSFRWIGRKGLPERLRFVLNPFIPTVQALAKKRGIDLAKGDVTQAVITIAKESETNLEFMVHKQDHRTPFEHTEKLAEAYIDMRYKKLSVVERKQKIHEALWVSDDKKIGHTVTGERNGEKFNKKLRAMMDQMLESGTKKWDTHPENHDRGLGA